jgi:hypothetical protein
MTPLQICCKAGNEHTSIYLLEKGADPDHVDDIGRTALHWVCPMLPDFVINRQATICRALLRRMREVNIELKDWQGQSAMELA